MIGNPSFATAMGTWYIMVCLHFVCVFMLWLRGGGAHTGKTSIVFCFEFQSLVPDFVARHFGSEVASAAMMWKARPGLRRGEL